MKNSLLPGSVLLHKANVTFCEHGQGCVTVYKDHLNGEALGVRDTADSSREDGDQGQSKF